MKNDRKAVGAELKTAYFNQAARNLENVKKENHDVQMSIFETRDGKPMTEEEENLAIDEERREKMIKKSHQGC